MRVDWRSLTGGHRNPRRHGVVGSGLVLDNTHFHPFDQNYAAGAHRMRRGNLRMATAIMEPLQTFTEVRNCIGNLFRINNINVVKEPPWEYKLPLEDI
jgi:hypothetical protein